MRVFSFRAVWIFGLAAGLLSSCAPPQPRHLVDEFYSYSTVDSIIPELNKKGYLSREFGADGDSPNFEYIGYIHRGFKGTLNVAFWKGQLMSVEFFLELKDYDDYLKQLKLAGCIPGNSTYRSDDLFKITKDGVEYEFGTPNRPFVSWRDAELNQEWAEATIRW